MEWLVRMRPSGWPSSDLVKEIFDFGYHLAPIRRGKRFGEHIDTLNYCQNPEVSLPASSVLPAESMLKENGPWKKPNGERPFHWQKISLGKAFLPCSDTSWFC